MKRPVTSRPCTFSTNKRGSPDKRLAMLPRKDEIRVKKYKDNTLNREEARFSIKVIVKSSQNPLRSKLTETIR